MFRVRIVDKIDKEGLELFGGNYAVSAAEPDPDAIVVRSSEIDTDAWPSLLAVARAGAGVNNITVKKATSRGVCVLNAPGANANAVAELVFIMLGISARNIHLGIDFCKGLAGLPEASLREKVEARKKEFRGFELAGKRLAVLGLGQIGLRVANAGLSHGMRVIGFDPFPSLANIHQLSAEVELARSMNELLAGAEILTLHVPLSNKTRGLVSTDFLAGLKDGTILINYSRGEIADERAILAALDSGKLAGYLTDFPSAALVGHPRVICSPHLGASTSESEEQCARIAVGQLKAYLEYGSVGRSVNFPTAESIPAANVHSRLIMINKDVPGMIGFASQAIGDGNVNIASYLNESNGVIGYNIIDVESAIPEAVLAVIDKHPGVVRTRIINYG
ncbi:MAG: 3-phosphoglycerate dehydrogenase family protein [Desulfurivibrionaceae bacterium]|nr:3-phosphoglycerate dehydrogenase family protein [Desulfobulbales bacterium]MDT8335026.1 3-phosphoglycerate dehydrogenase family protein [Desulfurivibrionaceae bacterium]